MVATMLMMLRQKNLYENSPLSQGKLSGHVKIQSYKMAIIAKDYGSCVIRMRWAKATQPVKSSGRRDPQEVARRTTKNHKLDSSSPEVTKPPSHTSHLSINM